MQRAPTAYTYSHDGLGSPLALTNESGSVLERYSYGEFGQLTANNVPTGATGSASFYNNPILFTGREWEPEAQVYYYRARYYSPATGRFLSRDPLGYGPDINVYRYVRNNPGRWIDPFGLDVRGIDPVRGGSIDNPMPDPVPHIPIDIPIEYQPGGNIDHPTIDDLGGGVIDHPIDQGGSRTPGFEPQPPTPPGGRSPGDCKSMGDLSGTEQPGTGGNDSGETADEDEGGKRHTPEQEAAIELAKEAKRRGVSDAEADALLELAREVGLPVRDDRGKDHWGGRSHIHVGGYHIPVN